MAKSNWQADGKSRRGGSRHGMLKRGKRRCERRRAKGDPSCQPRYGRYWGYEL